MEYEIFRETRSREEFFNSWDPENQRDITTEIEDTLYNRYLVKAEVFQRDDFKCQNIECKWPNSKLELHHVKFRKNGGEDKERNCVTLCHACHTAFHRAIRPLVFPNDERLPSHIRGHTFQLDSEDNDGPDWKQVRAEMRRLRKGLKMRNACPKISWEKVTILMHWLFSE